MVDIYRKYPTGLLHDIHRVLFQFYTHFELLVSKVVRIVKTITIFIAVDNGLIFEKAKEGNIPVHHQTFSWSTIRFPPMTERYRYTRKKPTHVNIMAKGKRNKTLTEKCTLIILNFILTEALETSDLFSDCKGLLWKILRVTQVSPIKLLRPSLSSSKIWSLLEEKAKAISLIYVHCFCGWYMCST